MRDIRTDLRERLASVAARYSDEIDEHNRKFEALKRSHEETLRALARERAALEQLLAIEDERAGIRSLTIAQKFGGNLIDRIVWSFFSLIERHRGLAIRTLSS